MVAQRKLSRRLTRTARGILAVLAITGMVLAIVLVSPIPVSASLMIDEPITLYTIDFSSFTGSGFAPEPETGQLDSDTWRIAGMSDGDLPFGGTFTIGDYAKGLSTGDVGPSGIYGFEVTPGVITLGVQPKNTDFTPGEIVLRIQNNTSDLITSLQVGYDLWFNNNKPYATAWSFHHSADDLTFTHAGGDYTSGEAADGLGWQSQTFLIDLNGLSIDHGEYYYLKWASDDGTGHGQRDEFGLNNIAVSAIVVPVNYPPGAVDDTKTTVEDTPETIDVLANDSDVDEDVLLLDCFSQPANGVVTRDDNGTPSDTSDDQLTYIPNADWSGDDSFTYTISDDNSETDTADVDVSVTPLNDPPDAVDDTDITPEDMVVTIDVLFNDNDPDGDTLLLDSFTQPAHGVVTRDENGTPVDTSDDLLTYNPGTGWSGDDSFTYAVDDQNGETDTATVQVAVDATYPYKIYLPLIMR